MLRNRSICTGAFFGAKSKVVAIEELSIVFSSPNTKMKPRRTPISSVRKMEGPRVQRGQKNPCKWSIILREKCQLLVHFTPPESQFDRTPNRRCSPRRTNILISEHQKMKACRTPISSACGDFLGRQAGPPKGAKIFLPCKKSITVKDKCQLLGRFIPQEAQFDQVPNRHEGARQR